MIGSEGTLIHFPDYLPPSSKTPTRPVPWFSHDRGRLPGGGSRPQVQPVAAVELLDRPVCCVPSKQAGLPPPMIRGRRSVAALLIESARADAAALEEAPPTSWRPGGPTLEPLAFHRSRPARCTGRCEREPSHPSAPLPSPHGHDGDHRGRGLPVEIARAPSTCRPSAAGGFGYHEAIIFGHAWRATLHFVFTQDFGDAAEVERYARFMDDVCRLVVENTMGPEGEARHRPQHGALRRARMGTGPPT